MLTATEGAGWLGYALNRGRGRVRARELGDRVLLLGRQSGHLATLFAYAVAEAGRRLTILDVDGTISDDVQGYFGTSDYHSTLYEAFHLEGDGAMHGQLVASTYASALDLTPEEEAIISAALQKLSEQNDLATPSALYDAVGAIEGFRGFYVDKLKGRMGALRHLDTARIEEFDGLMRGGSLVSFASAPYPQAAELAAGLYIAKMLYLLTVSKTRPDALMVTGVHRLFRNLARFQHAGKLMAHLLEAPIPLILVSPMPALLSDIVVESMTVRIYSSEAWNALKSPGQVSALARSFVICDDRSGVSAAFVPRYIRPKRPSHGPSAGPRGASPVLTRMILEEISKFDTANRQSIISFLSPQFLPADIGAEIDRLYSEGYLLLEAKQDGGGPKMLAFTVTEAGRRLLRELDS